MNQMLNQIRIFSGFKFKWNIENSGGGHKVKYSRDVCLNLAANFRIE